MRRRFGCFPDACAWSIAGLDDHVLGYWYLARPRVLLSVVVRAAGPTDDRLTRGPLGFDVEKSSKLSPEDATFAYSWSQSLSKSALHANADDYSPLLRFREGLVSSKSGDK